MNSGKYMSGEGADTLAEEIIQIPSKGKPVFQSHSKKDWEFTHGQVYVQYALPTKQLRERKVYAY